MRNQQEFKQLVEHKLRQQRVSRDLRRGQLTAWITSLSVVVIVATLSLYFLYRPLLSADISNQESLGENNVSHLAPNVSQNAGGSAQSDNNTMGSAAPESVGGSAQSDNNTMGSTAPESVGGNTEAHAQSSENNIEDSRPVGNAGCAILEDGINSGTSSSEREDPIKENVSENDIDGCKIYCADPDALGLHGLTDAHGTNPDFADALCMYLYEAAYDVDDQAITAASYDALDDADILLKATFMAEDKVCCVITITTDYTLLWHSWSETNLRTFTKTQQSQLRYALENMMQNF